MCGDTDTACRTLEHMLYLYYTNSFNVFQVMLHITYHQTVVTRARVEIQIQRVEHWNTCYISTTLKHNMS